MRRLRDVFGGVALLYFASAYGALACDFNGKFKLQGLGSRDYDHSTEAVYLDSLPPVAAIWRSAVSFDPRAQRVTHLASLVGLVYQQSKLDLTFYDSSGNQIATASAMHDWICDGKGLRAEYDADRGGEGNPGAVHIVESLENDQDGLNWTTETVQTKGHNWGGPPKWRHVRRFERSPESQ